jgi:hypothetical protein
MTIHGEVPYLVRGIDTDYKRLFYSRPEQALMREVTIQAGYGILPAGTPLAISVSAAGGKGKYVPYCPTTPDSSVIVGQRGNAPLVQDGSGTTLYVTLEDSYKFAVGDDVIIYDANTKTTAAENLGAITAIDRTTYRHMAVITVTETISGSFTVAQSAAIHIECGADNTNGYSDCAGILISSVDTGIGELSKGALAPMLISNAILYEGLCDGIDAAAKTDISATSNGNLLIIK